LRLTTYGIIIIIIIIISFQARSKIPDGLIIITAFVLRHKVRRYRGTDDLD